ncbi:DNA-binding LacI/PurR family transcriptional regulator [Arcanobacterium wilhelmae]|uniref:DNA-binding LacI/PurR family transcriptional regulator n=1 Tax=Arcanobacterium wilhelmae TaxID=1803177 RepID=A0ABT9N9W3_9ACTO|nr:LacI family DNA-binding transcriptional regulator [Arcanobacterium wilhelmae]MDP9800492.1 DNA-binding LacI/PurR family transcriptional regulator [Arcanobacterium wilhelmae]WFN89911.1 LacI family DNA-binding transcriptional regulator [Arcanobacterium wilhelmae]
MSRRIRLSDLAQQAGVSTATVSRVINGKDTVAPETRQAVLEALDLLGYERPEKLRERTGGLIGLIVPELTNPIFPKFVQALSGAMTLAGYTPLLGTQNAGGATEDSLTAAILTHGVSGLVFVSGLHADSTASLERYETLLERGIPFVTINGANPALDVPDFSTDDADAVTQAVRHLARLGHTKIGYASGPLRFIPSAAKLEAFTQVMAEVAPGEPVRAAHTLFTVEGGHSAAKALIEGGATAIVCASDIMALGVIDYCAGAGLSIPGDVSVIGFDDSTMMPLVRPALTTIRQPVQAIADAAVATLVGRIGHPETPMFSATFKPELVVRETTAPPSAK